MPLLKLFQTFHSNLVTIRTIPRIHLLLCGVSQENNINKALLFSVYFIICSSLALPFLTLHCIASPSPSLPAPDHSSCKKKSCRNLNKSLIIPDLHTHIFCSLRLVLTGLAQYHLSYSRKRPTRCLSTHPEQREIKENLCIFFHLRFTQRKPSLTAG